METLEIRLLGGFQLGIEDRILEQLPLRAARSLFAFLVLNRERAHTRDLLAGTFWPDFDESRARRRLSQALWQIQATIGDEDRDRYIIGTPDTVRFNPEASFELDVDEFEQLLGRLDGADRTTEAEILTRAVDIYRGDLLAGFYDDWLFPDQDRLRTAFLGTLERLADLAMARGHYETAIVHARRLATEDEFDEEAHRRVMRVAVLLGRHNEAIKQFEECRRILADELGTEPSAETLELYEATLADKESGGRALPPHEESPLFESEDVSPFVGREGERSTLASRLDEVLEGKGGLVLLEGESGVGKSRLLAEIANDAGWRGIDVLWGRSVPSGGKPYAPLAEALVAGVGDLRARQLAQQLEPVWLEHLAPLVPALAGFASPQPAERLRRDEEAAKMREAITLAFKALARHGPTLVVVEDVHWADDDTLQTLAQIANRIEDERILFAVSYRHGEAREREDVWGLLRELDRHPACERLSLAPHSPAQTEELIRRSLGLPEVSSEFSERLHRETGGIPLFVVETLRALYEQDRLTEAEAPLEAAEPHDDRLPVTPTVHALIRHRLSGLEPETRKALELAAVHDGDLLLAEIVAAAALEDQAALQGIDDLIRRRLLAERDGTYHMGHELMRRVVYDDLSLSQRLDMHRRVALAIEEHRPDEVEVLAHHFTEARMPDRAAEYLERAAERALAVHAYDTAALHLARVAEALDDIGAPAVRRFEVASLHEEVLDVLGRRLDQEHAIGRMQRFAPEELAGDVHRRRAWWLAHQDRFPEAEEEAGLALELATAAGDDGRAVSALSTLGMIACFGGRAAEGVVHLEAAAEYRNAGQQQEADARNALGQNLIDLQRFGEAESQLLAALTLYETLSDARGKAEVLGMLGTLRMERGEPAASETYFKQAIETSTEIGYRHGEAVYRMNLGILLIITNRLGEAISALDEAERVYAQMGNRRGQALVLSNKAWLWHAIVGRDDEAQSGLVRALEVYEDIGDLRGRAQCLVLEASIAGRTKSERRAIEVFEEALKLTRTAEDSWLTAQGLREFASFEMDHGFLNSAQLHCIEAERLCKELGMNDLIVAVRALAGRIHLRLGDVEAALDYCDRAMREIRPGIELAHLVPFALSEVYMELGDKQRARDHVNLAYEYLERTLSTLSDDMRKTALENVPVHSQIVSAWTGQQPSVIAVVLPSIDAPTGRALDPSEAVTVLWTIDDPDDAEVGARIDQRRHRILRLTSEASAQSAAPTVEHLAEALGSSVATIRRDISALRELGHHVPTRGSR